MIEGWSEYDNKSNTNGMCKDWEWVNNNRDCMKKGVSKEYIKNKYNYSNKPKLKLSMFDVKIIIYWQPWR